MLIFLQTIVQEDSMQAGVKTTFKMKRDWKSAIDTNRIMEEVDLQAVL